ncbi:1-acyl-sn-glycerol-3-phosphate acyltransferase PlsC [Peptoclostridium acidaminophilum DSM 3953]|uniref:1-acyl-sn-glycerol-3-phosphate acyltransferase n=1 Tax=Peptoclostridium acidaminophilum DSM 3953 TaxID=1286171 RepID=W8T1G9_PEPAC|nr:lysophospholipid acyltransferase family protein [Peptoclostridium acidaminophilum]AHM55589.1 1-acyl-sn-glycerol-3-phosphate acyltransferase PlsC [Peptoclostridium acidaminophilum DSM 3953]
MTRSIKILIYLVIYLTSSLGKLKRVSQLEQSGKKIEKDKIVNETVSKWAKAIVRLSGSRVSVQGQENIPSERAVVFVSNHQSNFDIPILLGCIDKPKAFIAKIELKKLPVISSWMEKMGCIFMDRNDARQSLKSISSGSENVKKGYSMVIFPEGTRSEDGKLREFKPGSLKLATKAKAPIVPVTIIGSKDIMLKGKLSVYPSDVRIVISKPIYTDELSKEDEKNLGDIVRGEILKNLGQSQEA